MAHSAIGNCYACGASLEGLTYFRGDTCPSCSRDLRVCKNCSHYSPQQYNECKETIADRVTDKEKANFCDLFSPGGGSAGGGSSSREALRAAAAKLFKD